MAIITLDTLSTYWKNVSDWVMGNNTSNPKISITGTLIKAGKITDADVTDRIIDATSVGGFYKISLDCSQCTSEMSFTIDEAISGSTKIIYVEAGSSFSDYLKGNILHYSGAGSFNYILSR